MIVVALLAWFTIALFVGLGLARMIRVAEDAREREHSLTLSVQSQCFGFMQAERRERGMLIRAALSRTPQEFAQLDKVRGSVESALSDDGEVLVTAEGRKMSRDEYLMWLEEDMKKMGVDVPPIIHAEGL